MAIKTIHSRHHHFGWDNALEAALTIEPGDEVEFGIVDASGGQITMSATAADVAAIDFENVNPVTGPVRIVGAEPGDAIEIHVLGFAPSGWGWTALIPGFGLLSDEFPDPVVHISRYDAQFVEFLPGVRLPSRPFPGTIGLAPAERGAHSIVPPREVGGNLDIRDLVEGSTLLLPVQVPGALFSVGDTHACQGDGEVCGTAVETPMRIRLRFGLVKDSPVRRPQFTVRDEATRVSKGGYHATTGVAPDLMTASRDAIRDMIDHLGRSYGLAPDIAYMLCSVAVDLRISEIVDAPNWVVSAYLPKGIFV